MDVNLVNWRENLAQILSAAAEHKSPEQAAAQLVSVSTADLAYHESCVYALEQGIRALRNKDQAVLALINERGNPPQSTVEAAQLLSDFLCVYLTEYVMAADLAENGDHELNSPTTS